MAYNEDEYLQLSGIQHFRFCRRQWALIHIENLWAENVRTVDGELMHERAHDSGLREKRAGVIVTRDLAISSQTLGASGACDVVEFRKSADGIPLPGEEGRFLPYFFPDVFTEGGDPIGEARTNWMKARRAILRSPLDRIGYGGYLKLASNWPGFIDEIQNVVGEFRQIHENMQDTKSYVAPFKVAILNCWGGLRKWMSNQVHHSIYHRETYSAEGVLECLSGMPFDVEFIDFDDIRNGIPEGIGVIINVGDAYTAFSGAENWIDEKVVTAIRKFVDEGGGRHLAVEVQGRAVPL